MASLNKVFLVGNLGADPELRRTNNNNAVATLNLATKEFRSDRDGNRQEYTEWHRVVVWGRQAENCAKYLAKGRPVMIEGRLQTRAWEDKNGVKRYTTEIVANNIQFLSSGAGASRDQGAPAYAEGADHQAQMGGGDFGAGSADMGNMSFGGPDTPSLDDIPF
jgi:single-strand DNA-binding protein